MRHEAFEGEVLLKSQGNRTRSFGSGILIECALIAAVVIVPLFFIKPIEAVREYAVMPLMITDPVIKPPVPKVIKTNFVPKPKPQVPKPALVELPQPKLEVAAPKVYTPVKSSPIILRKKAEVAEVPQIAKTIDQPILATIGLDIAPALTKPREVVQTGGFGAGDAKSTKGGGSPHGNSTVNAGFSDGGGDGTSAHNRSGVVNGSGFDHATVAMAAKTEQPAVVRHIKPIVITLKPRPTYTAEAKEKKIEGDVVLKVIFLSTGEVRVENVVDGLGFGLDGAAESAARNIKFHPAEDDGRAVDFEATIHVTFALAY
jgi:TonB family protein